MEPQSPLRQLVTGGIAALWLAHHGSIEIIPLLLFSTTKKKRRISS